MSRLSENLGWQLSNKTPLADEDVATWAAYAYWEPRIAAMLIMGLEPLKGNPEYYLEEGDAERYVLGNRREHLLQIISSALFAGDIEGHPVTNPDDGMQFLKPYPFNTIEYLVSKGIEVDERLRAAVLRPTKRSDTSDYIRVDSCTGIDPASSGVAEHQYCFIKTAQSWDIQCGNAILKGVKDYAGMAYIKLLLTVPWRPIGVIEIQAMMNQASMHPSNNGYDTENLDYQTDPHPLHEPFVPSSKSAALDGYRRRLLELSQERQELEDDCGHIELERIDNEVARIETEIDNIRYAKNDDPELEANRKKVYKNITDAIKNIKKLECKAGYTDAPISEHLARYIETGVTCTYNPPRDNAPCWIF